MINSLCLWAVLFVASEPVKWKATMVDGQVVSGSVTSLDKENVVIKTDVAETTVQLKNVLNLVPANPPVVDATVANQHIPAVWIELINHTRIPAKQYLADKDQAKITTLAGSELNLPIKNVAVVHWSDTFNPKLSGNENSSSDQLWVKKKNDAVDSLEGVIGEITKETVNFTMDGESIPVKSSKVVTLMYVRRPESEVPSAICVIEDVAGAHYEVKSLEWNDNKLKLTTLEEYTVDLPLDQIRKWDYSTNKLQYLSDLKPESMTFTPYFDIPKQNKNILQYFAPRFDHGRDDAMLKLDGKNYTKGIAMHSRTELVYKLPGKFRKLQAVAGIDDSVGDEGHIKLKILGDGKELFSKGMAGKDKAIPLDIDITNTRKLTILVDYGEDLDVSDYFDLGDARVVK